MNIEGIDIKDIEFGEPIEEREPNYRDGYIRGIYRARNIIDSKQREIERLNNIINELEKDLENRLMSIPSEILTDEIEEIKRTTKIAVYQVILGKLEKLQELKGSNNGVWVNNLLEVIKENNIEFGSDKE